MLGILRITVQIEQHLHALPSSDWTSTMRLLWPSLSSICIFCTDGRRLTARQVTTGCESPVSGDSEPIDRRHQKSCNIANQGHLMPDDGSAVTTESRQ